MKDSDPIRQYLTDLAASLALSSYPAERILHEVEDHLRQRTGDLQSQGWQPQEAALEAIARFGTPHRVASQFQQQPPLPNAEEIMIRLSMTVLVALISLYAGAHVVFSLVNDPAAMLSYIKIVYAAIVVAYGVLILRWQWASPIMGDAMRCAIFVGGLALIEIGAANMVWATHLGIVSGDWEFYGFVGGALVSLLGAVAATLLAFPNFPNTSHQPQPVS